MKNINLLLEDKECHVNVQIAWNKEVYTTKPDGILRRVLNPISLYEILILIKFDLFLPQKVNFKTIFETKLLDSHIIKT